jgi:hypothetical protein
VRKVRVSQLPRLIDGYSEEGAFTNVIHAMCRTKTSVPCCFVRPINLCFIRILNIYSAIRDLKSPMGPRDGQRNKVSLSRPINSSHPQGKSSLLPYMIYSALTVCK